MKKIGLILFTFICFFSVTTVARATMMGFSDFPDSDEFAFCIYYNKDDEINYPVYFYYDVQNDIFDYGFLVGSERYGYSKYFFTNAIVDLTPSDFINSENRLQCPFSIWRNTLKGILNVTNYYYIDNSHGGEKVAIWYPKSDQIATKAMNVTGGVLSKRRYCSWQDGSLDIEAIIDTKNKRILSATVNGKEAKKFPTFYSLYDDSYIINDPKSCRSDVLAYCNGDNCVIGNSSDENFMKERDKAKGEVVGGDEVYGCEVIPEAIRNWIKRALNLVKYIALVLVIVLGVMDFIKASASGEADQMKKSGTSFMKRVVAVVILFLLPYLVDLILGLINIYGANSTCLPNK